MTTAIIWLLIWIVLMVLVVILVGIKRTNDFEQALDDAEQQIAISKPAELRPHKRAGTSWMGDVQ